MSIADDSSEQRDAARKRLAENVRIFRIVRGWSQEALATAAELDRSYVGAIERGQRNASLDILTRLAGAFGIAIPELLQPVDPKAIGESLLTRIRRPITGRRDSR